MPTEYKSIRVKELEIAIKEAMEMCSSKEYSKKQVYELLAEVIAASAFEREGEEEDEDEEFVSTLDEKEYLLYAAQDFERITYATP